MADVLGLGEAQEETKVAGPGRNEHAYWLRQIRDAQKREEKYITTARKYISLYEAEKKAENSFNILYSNTETLAPALYNNAPRPDTRPRSKVPNPVPPRRVLLRLRKTA